MATRGQWAIDFLMALGNQAPSVDTIDLVAAWTKGESTAAKYNPLATTLKYGTSSDFNSVGVKNYSTRQEGIEASVMTLRGDFSGYSDLRIGLASDDPERALTSGGLDTWGTGTAAVTVIYRTQDVRGEMLASEGTNEQLIPQPSLVDTLTKPSPTLQPVEVPKGIPKTDAGPFSEKMLATFFKQTVGWVFISTGVVILVVMAVKSDAAKEATKTATNVAKVAAVAAA